jgi:hypothetical protein
MYNLEHNFTSVPRPPQNVLTSVFGDLVTPYRPTLSVKAVENFTDTVDIIILRHETNSLM